MSRFVTLPMLLAAALPFANQAAAQAPQLLPYTVNVVGGGGTAAIAKGALCPVSGNTSADAYGDGCQATEVQLTLPEYAITDKNGNIFFSDYTAGLVRRIDAVTGIVSLVAGGATASPAAGTACGTGQSVDAKGDGCLANLVNLFDPAGLAFDATGNLYVVEGGGGTTGTSAVRKIAATGGLITTTGVITLVAGSPSLKTIGYATNQGTNNGAGGGTILAGTAASLLNYPASIAFDKAGNLYLADEGNEALEVINTTAATETIQGISVPAGTIAKFAGYGVYQAKTTTSECPNGGYTSSTVRGGCYFGTYSNTTATPAAVALLDAPYAIAVDPSGNVYFDNEYIQGVGKIVNGSLTNYAGINGSYTLFNNSTKPLPRAAAGSFAIGSNFGIAVDANSNTYITDNLNGVIWRVDAPTGTMYAIAGTEGSPCSTVIDAYGDGCPATTATFGKSGTSYSSTGVYGVYVDQYEDLFVGDSITKLIREVSSGTQFGSIGANQPTQTVEIHYAVGDGPASSSPYTLTTGAANFLIGTPGNCTSNTDGTMDCLLPITATPSVLGPFSGTLTVASKLGQTASFPLNGNFVQSPLTHTTVTATAVGSCSGSTAFSTSTTVTLTATVASSGTPTGTVQFYNSGVAFGTAQTVTNGVATLSQTFPAGSYVITAVYSGDTYFKTSTSVTAAKFSTSLATFYFGTLSPYQSTMPIPAGQTALYSFTVNASVYTGTLSFACSGLPAGAACVFSPATIAATGCSLTGTSAPTVALSITTSAPPNVITEGFGGGRGAWRLAGILSGVLLALMIGLRRRRMSTALGTLGMMAALLLASTGLTACSATVSDHSVATPSGTYPIVVTLLGSNVGNTPPTGFATTLPVTLIVK